jgi:hypothetical protein
LPRFLFVSPTVMKTTATPKIANCCAMRLLDAGLETRRLQARSPSWREAMKTRGYNYLPLNFDGLPRFRKSRVIEMNGNHVH